MFHYQANITFQIDILHNDLLYNKISEAYKIFYANKNCRLHQALYCYLNIASKLTLGDTEPTYQFKHT